MNARALLTAIVVGVLALPILARPSDAAPTASILCYHIVESPQDPRMEVSRETFRQQMRYLAMTGYHVIPLRELYEYVSGKRASIPKNAVVITIDDGWRSTFTEVFPEMEKLKFPFTVFVYPRIIGQTSHALSWKQVKEMSDAGVDIQSHSLSHPFLSQRRHASLDEKTYSEWLTNELTESKKILEKETGRPVDFLAYPYGDFDHQVAAASAHAGYVAALTCEFGRVRRGSDPLRMKRFVIDKRMDFAVFRHYLGANPLRIEETAPLPDQVFEPEQPVIVSAKIPSHRDLDPKSVGMALLAPGGAGRVSYDAHDGSISMVIHDAVDSLQGKSLRALIWATDTRTGKRVEATWTFHLPGQQLPQRTPSVEPATLSPATSAGASPAANRRALAHPATLAATKASVRRE